MKRNPGRQIEGGTQMDRKQLDQRMRTMDFVDYIPTDNIYASNRQHSLCGEALSGFNDPIRSDVAIIS